MVSEEISVKRGEFKWLAKSNVPVMNRSLVLCSLLLRIDNLCRNGFIHGLVLCTWPSAKRWNGFVEDPQDLPMASAAFTFGIYLTTSPWLARAF